MIKKIFTILLIALAGIKAQAQTITAQKTVEGSVMQSSKTLWDNLYAAPNFSQFVKVVQAAGVSSALSGTTPVTLLAPTNKALEKLAPGFIDTLLKPEHRAELVTFVNNHLITGKITSADISRQIKLNNGSAALTTLSGLKLTATIDANRNILLSTDSGLQAVIARFDVLQSNGLLHTLNAPLLAAPLFR